MTPEELEAIPTIEPDIVEKILVSVNSYYSQFETAGETAEVPVESDEVLAETVETAAAEPAETTSALSVEPAAERKEAGNGASLASKKEFDTIKNSEEVG
jgi:hypothetical protein